MQGTSKAGAGLGLGLGLGLGPDSLGVRIPGAGQGQFFRAPGAGREGKECTRANEMLQVEWKSKKVDVRFWAEAETRRHGQRQRQPREKLRQTDTAGTG